MTKISPAFSQLVGLIMYRFIYGIAVKAPRKIAFTTVEKTATLRSSLARFLRLTVFPIR